MNEIKKMYIVQQVEDKQMTGSQAAEQLSLSIRQVRRFIA